MQRRGKAERQITNSKAQEHQITRRITEQDLRINRGENNSKITRRWSWESSKPTNTKRKSKKSKEAAIKRAKQKRVTRSLINKKREKEKYKREGRAKEKRVAWPNKQEEKYKNNKEKDKASTRPSNKDLLYLLPNYNHFTMVQKLLVSFHALRASIKRPLKSHRWPFSIVTNELTCIKWN